MVNVDEGVLEYYLSLQQKIDEADKFIEKAEVCIIDLKQILDYELKNYPATSDFPNDWLENILPPQSFKYCKSIRKAILLEEQQIKYAQDSKEEAEYNIFILKLTNKGLGK